MDSLWGACNQGNTVRIEEGILTSETNKHVAVWNHEITLEKLDENTTRYTDIVEIDAGWKLCLYICGRFASISIGKRSVDKALRKRKRCKKC